MFQHRIHFRGFMLIAISLFSALSTTNGQHVIGSPIYGTSPNNEFGSAISMPDSFCVASGDPYSSDSIILAGKVRVFKWDGSLWSQKGSAIYGQHFNEQFGLSVSMPNRSVIAVGAPRSDSVGIDAGIVRIYHFRLGRWLQKGQTLIGDSAFSMFGGAIHMPDSNTIAIGASYYGYVNSQKPGFVKVFKWQDSLWVQKGPDIMSDSTYNWFGRSVVMSDSNHLSVGSPRISNGTSAMTGGVTNYRWVNGTWALMGGVIYGDSPGDGFGYDLSFPDSNTLAISPFRSGSNGFASVKVYSFISGQWIQIGADITGKHPSDLQESIVAMSDPNHLAVGSPGYMNTGELYKYIWNGNQWILQSTIMAPQIGEDIGYSVAMPHPNFIGTGSPKYDNDTSASTGNHGKVSVYRFCDSSQFSYGIDSIFACSSYRWIDSVTYTENNDTSTFTLTNKKGCDSIVQLNLTIVKVDTSVQVSSPTLTSNDSAANYQWFYCDSVFTPIPGGNQRSYTANSNGRYAVVIGKNSCVDTSACLLINDINLIEASKKKLDVFPNPFHDYIQINSREKAFWYKIYSSEGVLLIIGGSATNSHRLSLDDLPAGFYFLEVIQNQQPERLQIVKLR